MLTTLRKNTSLLAALVLGSAAFSGAAMANEAPVFNNVGVSYAHLDLSDASAPGFGADFEVMVNERFFFAGELLNVSDSNASSQRRISLEYTLLHLNLGYQFATGERTVGYVAGGISYADYKIGSSRTFSGASDDDLGYNLQIGVRTAVNKYFELDANLRHVDFSGDADMVATVGVRVNATERVSVGASYSFVDSNMEYYNISVRFRF